MSDAAFKKAFKGARRTHKERGQIASRQKLGLLEKHKDYVLRARDYHSKQDRVKRLREKAAARNPDEFYHKMVNTRTKNGVHQIDAAKIYSADELKIFKGQDSKYVQHKIMIERSKIQKMQKNMHFVDDGDDNDDEAESAEAGPSHLVFVDDVKQAKRFRATQYFNTHESTLHLKSNRPTMDYLETQDTATGMDRKTRRKLEKQRAREYQELEDRMDRQDKLQRIEQGMQVQKSLMSTGRRYKVTTKDKDGFEDEDKIPVYRWKSDRKR